MGLSSATMGKEKGSLCFSFKHHRQREAHLIFAQKVKWKDGAPLRRQLSVADAREEVHHARLCAFGEGLER